MWFIPLGIAAAAAVVGIAKWLSADDKAEANNPNTTANTADATNPCATDASRIFDNLVHLEHITHINNMESIIKYGLLSHNRAHRNQYVKDDIADQDVNSRRAYKYIGEIPLHDYVPLYFNSKNPMLYRRKNIQDELVILCLDKNLLLRRDIYFTDGNAASNGTLFFNSLDDIVNLDWNCIKAEYWNNYPDGKRIRCAEVLVPHVIPYSCFKKVVVRTERTRQRLQNVGVRAQIDGRYYFD